MRLSLSDGYTLPFATEAQVVDSITKRILIDGLPVVSGQYRPALPDAIADWRFALRRAATGKDEVTASVDHLAAHIVAWDVDADGRAAPINADFMRLIPEPILNQLVDKINTWAAKQKAADEGNSHSG